MTNIKLTIDAATDLAKQALQRNNTSPDNALCVANALVQAEIEHQQGHGLCRLLSYAPQAKNGKINGVAKPTINNISDALFCVDAHHGFAFPALDLAIQQIEIVIDKTAICLAGITRSHHFGQASQIVEKLAKKNYLAIVLGNTPKAIAPPPSKQPLLGTNPIAFAAPIGGIDNHPPLVIDMALSNTARGKIIIAKQQGEKIPLHWAYDKNGNATDDPTLALDGMLQPLGGNKGALLALMVEVMSAALMNGHFGFEASSLLNDEGDAPNLGQTIIAIDPHRLNPNFSERMIVLRDTLQQNGVHIAGSKKASYHQHAQKYGIEIEAALLQKILAL